MKRAIEFYAIAVWAISILPAAEQDDWVRLRHRASALESAGNYAEAATSYLDALRIAEQLGPHDRRLVLTLNSLASVYQHLGQFSEAEHKYRRALSLAKENGGQENRDYAVLLANLASL